MKQISSHAHVAKLCKQYLKSKGISCKTRSDSFSGGNSVDVHMVDINPNTFKQLRSELSKYQYGHFDGMTDCYEYSNTREDLPQVKFFFLHNDMSTTMKEKIRDYLKEKFEVVDDKSAQEKMNCWYDNLIYRCFTGSLDETCSFAGFWA